MAAFMKTLLTLCLSLIALCAFAQNRPAAPPPPPPNAPAAAPNPGAPTNPGAPGNPAVTAPAAPGAAMNPAIPANPGAPIPPSSAPGASVAPGAPGAPALPGASVNATLSGSLSPSPAASASASPAAAAPTGPALTGNFFIDNFRKGGPIMWPILIVSVIGLTVVIERIFWWSGRWFRRDPKRIEKVFTAIEVGDVAEASRLSRDSRDPTLRMMWNGLNHQHASLQGALQVAAGIEIKRAGRFLVVMDTLVTLAPLLGLLGTITGLIRSFSFLGNEEVAVAAVTGIKAKGTRHVARTHLMGVARLALWAIAFVFACLALRAYAGG